MKPELRSELLRRAEKDQAARGGPEPDTETMASVDGENLRWLRDLVAEVGWPGRSMVGEDGAHAAWLLAQHADQDPAFQRSCLDLMTGAVERGEATLGELAYLTDRVLLAEDKPQEYGTQMTGREDGWVPRNLRDPETVDERRAAMSLGPLHENIALMARQYGPPKPATFTCAGCGSGIEERFAPAWSRPPPDASGSPIPVLLTEANSGDGKRVEIYSSNHRLGTLTTADSADFLTILATARTDGQLVMGTAVHSRDASGRWALHVYRPEPS